MKIKAELWDKAQYLMRQYYDRMIHAVVYLDGKIDEKIVRKTISIMLEKITILRSRYIPNIIKPYWILENDDLTDMALTVSETDNLDKDLDEFLTSRFNTDIAPQFRVNLLKTKECDTIAFLVNHQCFDGADFKVFIYKFAEIYNDLLDGGKGDINVKSGTRSNYQIYSSMKLKDIKKAKSLYKNVAKIKHKISFPFTDSNDHCIPMIIKHKIDVATFNNIKAYGKKYNSTINDVILAACFRSLYNLMELDEKQRITVFCMIDLRRHIESGESAGFTNLTCLNPCAIDSIGPNFSDTLKKINDEMTRLKEDKFFGMSGIPLLELVYKLLPNFIAEKLIKAGCANRYIGMSNVGSIDANKLKCGNVTVKDAFLIGAIMYKPNLILTLTSFNKEITLTISIYGTESDKAIVEKFFKLLDNELKPLKV